MASSSNKTKSDLYKAYSFFNQETKTSKHYQLHRMNFAKDTVNGQKSFIGDTYAMTPFSCEIYRRRDSEFRLCEREDHGQRSLIGRYRELRKCEREDHNIVSWQWVLPKI
ncbi:Uncharacterized protein Rs2_17545 [Raphanus sativus]|nr:Uncharacterized protein Rs2_17545 [Raphanus sativus]